MRKCVYCLKEKEEKKFNREHIIPRQLGSFDFATIKICKECNSGFSEAFEKTIATASKLKKMINGEVCDDTQKILLNEFIITMSSKRFLFKICFNFLYLLLPERVFFRQENNSINVIRDVICGTKTEENKKIEVSISQKKCVENYKKIYRFTISNEIKENKENGCISIQLDVCNCFTIKLYLDIATKNEELLYTFNFKENGKVEIIDYQEEKTLRWNEKNKKNIQEKLEKIIF